MPFFCGKVRPIDQLPPVDARIRKMAAAAAALRRGSRAALRLLRRGSDILFFYPKASVAEDKVSQFGAE